MFKKKTNTLSYVLTKLSEYYQSTSYEMFLRQTGWYDNDEAKQQYRLLGLLSTASVINSNILEAILKQTDVNSTPIFESGDDVNNIRSLSGLISMLEKANNRLDTWKTQSQSNGRHYAIAFTHLEEAILRLRHLV